MIDVAFKDRVDAGKQLLPKLLDYRDTGSVVLAIPMGGVPVACEVARGLRASMDLVLPRRLPIPWNPDAGFGAMTADGNVVLNRHLVDAMHITKAQIDVVSEMVATEIERHNTALRGRTAPPKVQGKPAIIVDDGLNSGYTMLAAVRYVRTLKPALIVVAAPVASFQAASLVESEADRFVTIAVSHRIPFAIADFYLDWRDTSVEDVKKCRMASLPHKKNGGAARSR
jgi:putative phosphoribosyl transferase